MGKMEVAAAFMSALTRHPEGLTADKAATIVKVPLRTARRHLLDLMLMGKAVRMSTYTGKPPTFAWLYKAAP